MEFQELLALAQKKQHKFDKEVQRIDRYAKLREIERRKQLENAEKINRKCNSQKILDIQKDPVRPSVVCNPNETNLPSGLFKECKVEKKIKVNPSPNSEVDSKKSKLNGVLNNYGVASSKANSKEVSLSENVGSKGKQNRMSFAELLEIAKNNVDDNIGQKRPFEELIPCSIDSNYLKMNLPCKKPKNLPKLVNSEDVELKSTKSDTSGSNKKVIRSKINSPDTLKETSEDHAKPKIGNSVSKVIHLKEISKKNGILAQLSSASRPIFKMDSSDHSTKRQKCVNDIKTSRLNNVLNSGNLGNHAVSLENSKCGLSSNRPVELKKVDLARLPNSTKVNEQIKHKQLFGGQALKQSSHSSRNVKSAINQQHTTVKSLPKGDNKSLSKSKTLENNSIKSKEKTPVSNIPAKAYTQGFSTSVPARGIAAQLGVFTVRPTANIVKNDVVYSTDDDYESEDSFIDDSEAIQSKDYARVVRDIHKALKFDPRKYKEVNPWDDLKSMEANYREIEKEERRSAKLGALEDNEEFIRDMLRKKQKHAKRKFIDDD